MTDPLPVNDVVHLPEAARRPPHVFGDEVMIPAEISDSGFDQKEKTCRNCGAVRVTVLGPVLSGQVWRAWRRGAGSSLIQTNVPLPCPSLSQVAP